MRTWRVLIGVFVLASAAFAAVPVQADGAGEFLVADAVSVQQIVAADDYDPVAHGDVLRLYRAFFDREPDAGGARYWIDTFEEGVSLIEIAGLFTLQQEYRNNYEGTSNREFLEKVYSNVLGRRSDPGGFAYWLDVMQGTNTSGSNTDLARAARGEVVHWVAASREFKNKYPYAPPAVNNSTPPVTNPIPTIPTVPPTYTTTTVPRTVPTSRPTTTPPPTTRPQVKSSLGPGQAIRTGQQLVSANGECVLRLQTDGNIVLKDRGRVVWNTRTDGKRVDRFEMQHDGNVVAYAGQTPIWWTGTTTRNTLLHIQDDCNLVAYAPGHQAVWSTGTDRPVGGDSPKPTPKVGLRQGDVAKFGYYYDITLSGFPANANVLVMCHDVVDPGGFEPARHRVDANGSLRLTRKCYSADGPDYWVTADGVRSNIVQWGNPGGGTPPTSEPEPIADSPGPTLPVTGPGEVTHRVPVCGPGWWVEQWALHDPWNSVDFNLGNTSDDKGLPVFATADGWLFQWGEVKRRTGFDADGNNYVVIDHDDQDILSGPATVYLHMERERLRPEGPVRKGELIGYVSDVSSKKINSHLHYEQKQDWVTKPARFETWSPHNRIEEREYFQAPSCQPLPFLEAARQEAPRIGSAINDPHPWGPVTIQDYDGGEWGRLGLILNPESNRAYVVRTAFWEIYKQNRPEQVGYPLGNERTPTTLERQQIPGLAAVQQFQRGVMYYTTFNGSGTAWFEPYL